MPFQPSYHHDQHEDLIDVSRRKKSLTDASPFRSHTLLQIGALIDFLHLGSEDVCSFLLSVFTPHYFSIPGPMLLFWKAATTTNAPKSTHRSDSCLDRSLSLEAGHYLVRMRGQINCTGCEKRPLLDNPFVAHG
jgi:hypothetical protein